MNCKQKRIAIGACTESSGFEKVSCPKCGSDESIIFLKSKDYLYHVPGEYFASECRQCGFWFQNPRPRPEQLVNLYPTDYSPHSKHTSIAKEIIVWASKSYLSRHLGYNHLLDNASDGFHWQSLILFSPFKKWVTDVLLIPHYIAEGKLLEIGCGSGRMLLTLRDLGWQQLYGIELVPEVAEQARSQGFSIECGRVEDTLHLYPDEYFDVIISSMVLEHLYNPFQVVRDISAKIKPGGQFLFSTVIRDSIDTKMYAGFCWSLFEFPRHMVYFRKKDIYDMLEDEFDHVECIHQVAPIDFVRSSTWRIERGDCKIIDRIILAMGESFFAEIIVLFLAWLGLTCRVSLRCKKKF